jgi:uncharacterized protein (DUF305 family)
MDSPSRNSTRPFLLALLFGSASLAAVEDASPQASAARHPRSAARVDPAAEARYLAENDRAMTKMMKGMAVKPTGDVDRDFVAMMVPHHQGAIDMAVAVLRYGSNERLKRLAQEIIVTQQDEIAALRLAVGEPLPPSIPAPTRPSPLSGQQKATSSDTEAK